MHPRHRERGDVRGKKPWQTLYLVGEITLMAHAPENHGYDFPLKSWNSSKILREVRSMILYDYTNPPAVIFPCRI